MIRLFVALRPPSPVRDALADLQTGVSEARWQDDEQLHLTLRFAGEVERHTAEDLADAVAQFRHPAIEARLHGVGAFGGRGRAGALWAGIAPREPLQALHRKIDQLCVRVGLEPERRAFVPHVTVGRLSRGAAVAGPEVHTWLTRHAGLASDSFSFGRVILYRSLLGRAGASYEALVKALLGPAA